MFVFTCLYIILVYVYLLFIYISLQFLHEMKVHKYILCGTVERNSWPESESAWDFVSVQKAAEKQDLESQSSCNLIYQHGTS